MIHASFKKKAQKWVAYEISGHAGYADNGYDIVCAAVSVLATNTCNGIERLANYQPIVDVEETLGGFLYVEILDDISEEATFITQILVQNLYDGLQDVAKEYPDFVKVTVV